MRIAASVCRTTDLEQFVIKWHGAYQEVRKEGELYEGEQELIDKGVDYVLPPKRLTKERLEKLKTLQLQQRWKQGTSKTDR